MHQGLFFLVWIIIFIKSIEIILTWIIFRISRVRVLRYFNQIFDIFYLSCVRSSSLNCCILLRIVFFTCFARVTIGAVVIIIIISVICLHIMSIYPFLTWILLFIRSSPLPLSRITVILTIIIFHHTFIIYHHLFAGQISRIIIFLLCYHFFGFNNLIILYFLMFKHLFLRFEARKESTKSLWLEGSSSDRTEITYSVSFICCLLLSQNHQALPFLVFLAGSKHTRCSWIGSVFESLTWGAGYW